MGMEMELKKSRKNREKFDFDGNSHENYDKIQMERILVRNIQISSSFHQFFSQNSVRSLKKSQRTYFS